MIAVETSDRRPEAQAAEIIRLQDVGVAPSKITERWNVIATIERLPIAAKVGGDDRRLAS